MYFIYTLADPRTGIIWYVGLTDNMYQRFMQHLGCRENNPEKNAWIRGLRSETLLPALRVLESVPMKKQAREQENYWIQRYLSEGMPLTNIMRVQGRKQFTVKSPPESPMIESGEEWDGKKLDSKETLQRLHISRKTLYALMERGQITPIPTPSWRRRRLYFRESDIERLLGKEPKGACA